jgi:hypothetical protein
LGRHVHRGDSVQVITNEIGIEDAYTRNWLFLGNVPTPNPAVHELISIITSLGVVPKHVEYSRIVIVARFTFE